MVEDVGIPLDLVIVMEVSTNNLSKFSSRYYETINYSAMTLEVRKM